MKLLFGTIAYLLVVVAAVVAVFAGVASLDRPKEPPVLAMETDGVNAGRTPRENVMPVDPNRVPVWIVPTAKYEYTPVPIEPRPKRAPVIGRDGLGAMAKVPPRTRPRPEQREADNVSPPARVIGSRQDNDPFFRD